MFKNPGAIVGAIIWIIWIVALEGKRMFPEVIGTSWFQWSCAAIVAVLIPIGTLIALRRFARPDQRRSGLGLLVVCVVPLVVNISFCGIGGPVMARTAVSLSTMNDRDAEVIAKFNCQAVEAGEAQQRRKAAWALYSLFGVRSAWRDDSGTLVIYTPGQEEESAWQRRRDSNSRFAASTESIDAILRQLPWLFGLNLGCFVVILLCGLVWQTYKGGADKGSWSAADRSDLRIHDGHPAGSAAVAIP